MQIAFKIKITYSILQDVNQVRKQLREISKGNA